MQSTRTAVAIAFLSILVFAQERSQTTFRTTVCDLLHDPDHFSGKFVQVRAQVHGGEEGSVLFDRNCSGSILFAVGDNKIHATSGSGPEFRKLMRLLKWRSDLTATVSGTFEHSADRTFGHNNMFDSRLLATSVSAVRADPGDRQADPNQASSPR